MTKLTPPFQEYEFVNNEPCINAIRRIGSNYFLYSVSDANILRPIEKEEMASLVIRGIIRQKQGN